jgi:hypothetical protein
LVLNIYKKFKVEENEETGFQFSMLTAFETIRQLLSVDFPVEKIEYLYSCLYPLVLEIF